MPVQKNGNKRQDGAQEEEKKKKNRGQKTGLLSVPRNT